MTLELKKYKKYFRKLPREQNTELEKALENGLWLTKHSVSGQGLSLLEKETQVQRSARQSKIVGTQKRSFSRLEGHMPKGHHVPSATKNFVQKLPTIYNKFQAIKQAEKNVKQKQKFLEEIKWHRKHFEDYFRVENTKTAIALGSTETGLFIYGMVYCGIQAAKGSPEGILYWLGAVGFGIPSFWNSIIIPTAWHAEYGYYGTTRLLAAGLASLIDRKSNARENIRKAKLGRAKRQLRKSEHKLEKTIKNTFYTSLPYTRKWYKEEKEELLKMLTERDESFPITYLEVETKLVASDMLELRKNIEGELYLSSSELKKEKPKRILEYNDKLGLAKAAGLHTQTLEEMIKNIAKNSITHTKELTEKLKDVAKKE